MKDIKAKIKENFPDIFLDEKLNKYSTYFIGGPADYFYKAKSTEDLKKIISFSIENAIPYYIISGGSNILFDDEGFRGIVIKIETSSIKINDNEVTADAGVKIAELIKESIKNNLSGLESWFSLPGTVGGAVRGNAGCNGLETKDILKKAIIFDPKTRKIKEVDAKYFNFSYRESKLKKSNEIILSATFKLKSKHTTKEDLEKIKSSIQETRMTKQPQGLSCGSFFKNPSTTTSAGSLIEKAGLKGKTIGKAKISEKHANFIINMGGASGKDILKLANIAKQEVKAKFKISLKEEVQIVPKQLSPIAI
jgi:UDP-N-acetylmuramate dehydrogenase